VYNFGPQEMFILMLVGTFLGVLVLLPWFKIVTKAGFSGWWCLAFITPALNLIALFYLAFAEWPALRRRDSAPTNPSTTG
jgi:uncharacterized membrane protein YhaH (DUF805 family)